MDDEKQAKQCCTKKHTNETKTICRILQLVKNQIEILNFGVFPQVIEFKFFLKRSKKVVMSLRSAHAQDFFPRKI